MKTRSFLILSLLLLVGCSSIGGAYDRVSRVVGDQFYRYGYYSDLKTYKAASYRPPASKDSSKYVRMGPRENWKNYKVGNPYQIAGKWYYPKEDLNYNRTGIASWYGPQFHNKLTANGEIFDKHMMTAAHKTLPMPSIVRVTNLENGRVISVRVNDRGPFKDNRIIDLSERAAYELGFRKQGTAKVKVEFDRKATEALFYDPWDAHEKARVKRAGGSRHITSPKLRTVDERSVDFYQEHYVQAGSYSTWDNASSVAKGLKKLGPVKIREGDYRGNIVYRVQLGPFEDVDIAGEVLDEMAMMGFSDAVVLGK